MRACNSPFPLCLRNHPLVQGAVVLSGNLNHVEIYPEDSSRLVKALEESRRLSANRCGSLATVCGHTFMKLRSRKQYLLYKGGRCNCLQKRLVDLKLFESTWVVMIEVCCRICPPFSGVLPY